MADRVSLVDFLILEPQPHLIAHECADCGARYFDRRNACASCGLTEFRDVVLPRDGVVTTFSIINVAAPGVDVPFVAAVVDLDGTSVRGNVVETPADPEHVRLGMPVRLTTFPIGVDSLGVEAVGYGFAPAMKVDRHE